LALGLPVLLLVRARWTALGTFAAGGAALAVASIALAPTDEYFTLLGSIGNYTIDFAPAKMIGLGGLAHWAETPLLYPAAAFIVAGLSLKPLRSGSLPAAYMIAVLGSLLCSYHVNLYDAAILIPCFAYVLAEKRRPWKLLTLALLGVVQAWTHPQWIAGGLLLLWAGLVFADRAPAMPSSSPD
jgi:hypothetical protein